MDANLSADRIVISGMSGLFPSSHHVMELADVLYNKKNPIMKNPQWQHNHPEVVPYTGKVPDLNLFDAQFFKVNYRLANCMDPVSRKILEQAFQAIYDAGVCPENLSGKKVGVFVGTCFSESEKVFIFDAFNGSGLGITGSNKSMFANRISYWLNSTGPSMSIDESCCSSIAALEQAYLAMSRGDCEAAIVGGGSICLHPQSSVHYGRLINISKDGNTKSFDEKASGYTRSEAINVIFLQKAKDALRIYADVIHVKSQFLSLLEGKTGPRYGYQRDPVSMSEFLNNFYKEARVSPQAVEYVEAFGSAVPEADKSELESIDEVFCKDRKDQLFVGNVMSNIGYGECASGISAVTKVLLGYHKGQLAANLNCENPRLDVEALRDGRIRILTEHQSFNRTYTAINGLSITGANAHILLHGNYKPKDRSRYKSNLPRLVTVSARQDIFVEKFLADLKSRPVDAEELALLHNIYQTRISGHLGRGFTILDTDEEQRTVSLCAKADYFDDAKRPLWFVYSGMGSQWAGMGAQLMRIPIFDAAIGRCQRVLEPKGVDIVHIITSPDKATFDNILNSFVGIAAIQIGLTDVLRELGLVPDNIIGHSVGELGCAYADGCFTAEEMILAAYYRGLVSVQTSFIRGSMAAVGIGYTEVLKMCPPEIEVACHNGPESSTISGPANIMKHFVAQLTAKQIFAKEVPCSDIAYHSRYIAEAGPALLKYLSEVIKSPKPRSERWLSTSVPQERWNEPIAKYSSAAYYTNNLLKPVLFEETSRLIPSNAVLVEIAPHSLLQAILKRSLPYSCTNVPLTRRGHSDSVLFLLEAIGKLYMKGYNPKVQALYPKIEFPVSTGTPFLSHRVEWVHDEKWIVPYYARADRKVASTCTFVYSVHDLEYNYLIGNILRGKNMFPFAAALVAVWDVLAMSFGVPKKQLSVEFNDVRLHSQPILHDQRQLRLFVSLHRGTGHFEIMDDHSNVATGYIIGEVVDIRQFSTEFNSSEELTLKSQDIYEILYKRGYEYRGEFQSIHRANKSLTEAQISWSDNWVTLIDALLQLNALRRHCDSVSLPTHIRKIVIDIKTHLNSPITPMGEEKVMTANIFELHKIIRCGGILVEDVAFRDLPTLNMGTDLMALKFVPYFQENGTDTQWGGEFFVPVTQSLPATQDITLQSSFIGDSNSLHWVEMPNINGPGVKVTVHYAGLNDTDVKRYAGIIPRDGGNFQNKYGMDFSGVTENGDRVMGLVSGGAVSTRVLACSKLLWPVPEHWSLEEAATVPLAYCFAFYCLGIKYKLQSGVSVLVHGGAGALGQAVISIALGNGCKVFTTVSDVNKKRFLLKMFPELKDDQIGDSRNNSFGDMVLSATNGYGCNVGISCVSGNLKNIALKCSEIMIDTVQIQTREFFSYGMSYLTNKNSYMPVDFSAILGIEKNNELSKLQLMVSEGIKRGYVRPLSRVTYAPLDSPRAFRLLATSRHRGRALLQLQAKTPDGLLPQPVPRLYCSPDSSHLILCNNDYFGLRVAERLVRRGARNIYLHGLKQSEYLNFEIRSLEKLGVKIKISNDILKSKNDVTALLNACNNLGAIEGVYVIATNKQSLAVSNNVIQELDAASRKICRYLKYFAVININEKIGLQTCFSRVQHKLPGTLIILPEIKKMSIDQSSATHETISEADAVAAFESALRSNETVIKAHARPEQSRSLLQEIANIGGIEVTGDVAETCTLSDLNFEANKTKIISIFLRDTHNISLSERDVANLTVHKILQIEDTTTDLGFKETRGLETSYSYVDPDELLMNTELTFLPTLANNSTLRDDEFDVTQAYLCIIPGLEGHHERFRILSERLKLPVLILQPGLDRPDESISSLAQRYAVTLLKKLELKQNFYLMGYESGVFVALEIAAILEDHGLTGIVYCIGGSPEEVHNDLKQQLKEFDTDEALEIGVVRHMYKLMVGGSTEGLENELSNASTWGEKVEACVRSLFGKVSHSAQYARELIVYAYSRIKQVQKYIFTPRCLRSKLILLHTAGSSKALTLPLLSKEPIIDYELRAPLAHSAADLRCSAIINRHLDATLLESFEKENICDTYLI